SRGAHALTAPRGRLVERRRVDRLRGDGAQVAELPCEALLVLLDVAVETVRQALWVRITWRGSSASRSPSPMKLIDTTARKMNKPGETIQGALSISLVASFSMLPQDAVGGWMPRPRNDRVLSVMIAPPTPRVAATMIGASAFGRMWRSTIRASRAPTDR